MDELSTRYLETFGARECLEHAHEVQCYSVVFNSRIEHLDVRIAHVGLYQCPIVAQGSTEIVKADISLSKTRSLPAM